MDEDIPVKLLLVDDVEANLTALEAILSPLGHELVKARSGIEALKYVLRDDFAAILLDVQMPEMDGFETARLLKERERSRYIPIIFLTARSDDAEFVNRAYSSGAVDFLHKPFNVDILKSKVAVFVSLFEQREQIRRQTLELALSASREADLRQEVREREIAEQHASDMNDIARRQRNFLRDILFSLTEGRLHLCDSASDLPAELPDCEADIPLTRASLRQLRHSLLNRCSGWDWPTERVHDFETGVGEAAMNAVVHGREARGRLCFDAPAQRAQTWVCDEGSGIAEESLHRATLERGFTTAGTLGHGFWIMLKTCDRVYLLTGKKGTTVVLEMSLHPPAPPWMPAGLE